MSSFFRTAWSVSFLAAAVGASPAMAISEIEFRDANGTPFHSLSVADGATAIGDVFSAHGGANHWQPQSFGFDPNIVYPFGTTISASLNLAGPDGYTELYSFTAQLGSGQPFSLSPGPSGSANGTVNVGRDFTDITSAVAALHVSTNFRVFARVAFDSVSNAPEPVSMVLLGSGVVLVAAARRRRACR